MGRCFKNIFSDNTGAMLGMGRCHGGIKVERIVWKPCRYLSKCLDMPVEKWEELTEDARQRLIAERNFV
jgi:hypothetical protein